MEFTVKSLTAAFPFPSLVESAVTNAWFASPPGLPVVRMPLDDARSASQTARSSRACMVHDRKSGRLPSAARRRDVALRLRSPRRSSPPPLHFPARRPQTEARGFIAEAGVTPGAIPLVVPTIPACVRLPPPTQILWVAP